MGLVLVGFRRLFFTLFSEAVGADRHPFAVGVNERYPILRLTAHITTHVWATLQKAGKPQSIMESTPYDESGASPNVWSITALTDRKNLRGFGTAKKWT